MKYIFSIILAFAVTHSVLSQICRDNIERLGQLAEPKRFEYVGYSKDAYYEVTLEQTAAFLICGEPVSVPVGSVVNLTGSLYSGSYNRMTGIWCETYIDINATNITRVYFLISDLKKLPQKPQKELFNDVGDRIRINKGYKILMYLSVFLLLLIGLFVYYIRKRLLRKSKTQTNILRVRDGSSYSGVPHKRYNPNYSESTAPASSPSYYDNSTAPTSSPSYNDNSTSTKEPAPKNPNEGYFVTGYDAYGPSERRDNFGLTTQRKNDFGHWENV